MGRRARKGNNAAIAGESSVRRFPPALLLLLLLLAPAAAAGQSPTGSIQGIVVEQLGDPLPGVAIAITGTESRLVRRTRSDDEGRFTVVGLPPGTYEVLASLDGYASQRQERIRLGIGQTVVSGLELRKAPMPETLTLASQPSMLEARHSDVISRIETVEIEHLPLAGRRVLDVLAVTPGLTTGPDGARIATAGADAGYASVTVDGVSQLSLQDGPVAAVAERPYAFSRSAVRDAAVIVSAPPAAFDRSGGASVSIVTRSGSEVFSGEVFEYFRDGWLSSNTLAHVLMERPTPSQRSDQFGGSAGGPLADGHRFFASYDGLRHRHENAVHLTGANGAESTALAPLLGSWTRTGDQHALFVRTDHRAGTGGSVTVRYSQLDRDGVGLSSFGPRQAFNTAASSELRTHAVSATVRRSSGSSFVNELRALYLDRDESTRPEYAGAQAIVLSSGATLLQSGSDPGLPDATSHRRLQVANTLMWAARRHMLQAGADVEVDDWRLTSAAGAGGAYVFASPERFGAASPTGPGDSFSQTFFAGDRQSVTTRPDSLTAAVFVQDKWLVHERLTVDAGLRFEGRRLEPPPVRNPSPELAGAGIDTGRFDIDGSAWGPRIGAAWAQSRRHVARAAYAVLHGRTPVPLLAAAHAYNGIDARPVTVEADGAVPAYPGRLASMPASARPGLVFFDSAFEPARFQHASLSYEWEWMPTTSIAGSYFHVRGDHLPRAIGINVGDRTSAPVTATDGTLVQVDRFEPGPFSGFGRVVRVESSGESRYDAFALELRRRLDQGWQYRISYTLGRVTDTAPASTAGFPDGPGARGVLPLGSEHLARHAPADHDIRHRLVLSSVLQSEILADRFDGILERALERWRVGVIYAISSGLPYSAYVSGDMDGDGNRWNDLAPGTARNAFRRPGPVRLDLRLSRDFPLPGGIRVTVTGDAFNVLNGRHYGDVDESRYALTGATLVPNPRFGAELDEVMPRTVQLGASIAF